MGQNWNKKSINKFCAYTLVFTVFGALGAIKAIEVVSSGLSFKSLSFISPAMAACGNSAAEDAGTSPCRESDESPSASEAPSPSPVPCATLSNTERLAPLNAQHPLRCSAGDHNQFLFERVNGGWRDLSEQGLIWLDEIGRTPNIIRGASFTSIEGVSADGRSVLSSEAIQFCADRGARLPSVEEFRAGESHHFRQGMPQWNSPNDTWFWSVDLEPTPSAQAPQFMFAYGFNSATGSTDSSELRAVVQSVRCVK